MSIKIENVALPSPAQMEAVIRGMRNPMNSWTNSDSFATYIEDPETLNTADFEYFLGEADETLMRKLANAGEPHRKYMRMMPVYLDITAPLYWWKEFDTYKVGTVANSCSTMHKIAAKEFTLDDFSCEHLEGPWLNQLKETIKLLNEARESFNWGIESVHNAKTYWWQMIQLLPSSYNQKRTVMLNYEVLANIYYYRKNHKLDCWQEFCKWIETLPYSYLITAGGVE